MLIYARVEQGGEGVLLVLGSFNCLKPSSYRQLTSLPCIIVRRHLLGDRISTHFLTDGPG
jgi:hypothetical protein